MKNIDKAKNYASKSIDLGDLSEIEIYTKRFLESLFCDGAPMDFDKITIEQLKLMHSKINECIEFVNS